MSTTAYVALGSNLGDRDAHLLTAVAALEDTDGIGVVECSPIYETEPIGPGRQSAYLNAVVCLETRLAARELLTVLQAIEARAGRTRTREAPRWTARTLDLDLLFLGGQVIHEPDLVVPHPRIAERSFVLVPLCDIAPDLVHPVVRRTLRELLGALPEGSAGGLPTGVRLWERCLRVGPPSS